MLIVSTDRFNHGPAPLVVVIPLTSRDRGIPLHVSIDPPEAASRSGRLRCAKAVRSLSTERFVRSWGVVAAMAEAWFESGVGDFFLWGKEIV